ncbi:MAG: LiaF-related protein [Eubacterium sp.]|nr:LiaF-related protein [Eubacterium sp.]
MRNRIGNILWGLLFILVGVGIGGEILDLWSFELFFDGWWTLFLIVPALIMIFQNGPRTGSCILLGIGVLLLLGQQDFLDAHLVGRLVFPLVLIIVGFAIIFSKKSSGQVKDIPAFTPKDGKLPTYSAVFGGQELRVNHEAFEGASLAAVFGGVDLDLRDAIITEDIVISAAAIFGGVDIVLPPNVKCVVAGTPVFGGIEDKSASPLDEQSPVVSVQATAIFGSVGIK